MNNFFALLVGVSDFDNPAIDNLEFVREDIKEFFSFLTNPRKAGYSESNIWNLSEVEGGSHYNRPTADNIRTAFSEIKKAMEATKNPTLLLYMSSHGGYLPDLPNPFQNIKLADDSEYVFIPQDFNETNPEKTLISSKNIQYFLGSLKNCKRKVVFLDTCHSDGIGQGKNLTRRDIMEMAKGTGTIILSSCKENEKSYPGNRLSLFTEKVIEGLEGKADFSSEKKVYAYFLAHYIQQSVSESDSRMTPIFRADNVDQDFVLSFVSSSEEKGLSRNPKNSFMQRSLESIIERLMNGDSTAIADYGEILYHLVKDNKIDALYWTSYQEIVGIHEKNQILSTFFEGTPEVMARLAQYKAQFINTIKNLQKKLIIIDNVKKK